MQADRHWFVVLTDEKKIYRRLSRRKRAIKGKRAYVEDQFVIGL